MRMAKSEWNPTRKKYCWRVIQNKGKMTMTKKREIKEGVRISTQPK